MMDAAATHLTPLAVLVTAGGMFLLALIVSHKV